MTCNASELTGAVWRRSTYSSGNGGECVEVAQGNTEVVPVRDSKNPHAPALTFRSGAWAMFVTGVKAGGLDARGSET
ncbi:DUF397 domain-containing protein [Streptomyces zingiberis]|uniref:DUF397 domain-containing protein n=1 Tax=Streptomyces zingiberis TaxID=2053010 RepID=A0ABX1C0S2_9ACTN|nr:DUF397 domain-containing protein [Streptomyces zingiberis]NJQ00499.1 DUF397 domain-containing protein [Streptomyces zingiberis]